MFVAIQKARTRHKTKKTPFSFCCCAIKQTQQTHAQNQNTKSLTLANFAKLALQTNNERVKEERGKKGLAKCLRRVVYFFEFFAIFKQKQQDKKRYKKNSRREKKK